MGHLIPAGTGFGVHRDIDLDREVLREVEPEEAEEEIIEEEEE